MPTRFSPRPVIMFSLVFYLLVVARMVFSPFLTTIEADIGIDHAQAGTLFLLISIGYAPMILLSGFITAAIKHSGTIVASLFIAGGSLLLISYSRGLPGLQVGMCILGVGAGLYISSGLASLMRAVPTEHWGRAIAVHEAAPNIASMTAPIIALLTLEVGTWRGLTRIFAILCLAGAVLFLIINRSSRFYGAAPNLGTLKHYLRERSFWILACFFGISASGALGVYSILPTYLVAERGMSLGAANSLMSIGRAAGLVLVFASGALADRIGTRRIIGGSIGLTAVATTLLGVLPTTVLPILVFFQPMIAVAFFPAAITAVAQIGPRESQNVAVSLTVFFGIVVGGGLFPWILGNLGEAGRFYLGFVVLGALMACALLLVPLLTIPERDMDSSPASTGRA